MKIENELKTKDAKINFLKGLIRIAMADGQLDDTEWQFYCQAAVAIGLDEKDLAEIRVYWESSEKPRISFATLREKMFFFIQAIQLCWIDNNYTDVEKDEIMALQLELNVNSEAINSIEEWVYEGIQWNKKGDLLLELE